MGISWYYTIPHHVIPYHISIHSYVYTYTYPNPYNPADTNTNTSTDMNADTATSTSISTHTNAYKNTDESHEQHLKTLDFLEMVYKSKNLYSSDKDLGLSLFPMGFTVYFPTRDMCLFNFRMNFALSSQISPDVTRPSTSWGNWRSLCFQLQISESMENSKGLGFQMVVIRHIGEHVDF